jgi:purine-nucleoside phosphorylase
MDPLQTIRNFAPEAAIVLGSGLGAFVSKINVVQRFAYHDIPGLPVSRVQGHAGELLLAEFAERRWLVYRGRVHLYEGWSPQDASRNVSFSAEMGCKLMVLTNAAGSLNVMHYPGTWMQITDQINLQGASPLLGGSRFLDMTGVYNPRYVRDFTVLAQQCGITMHQGVYAGVLGPQYETPAEVRMLRAIGADAVGMSTVLEAIQARALDMEVIGFSCLSNWAAGIHQGPLNHEEVLATGLGAAEQLAKLLLAWKRP